MSLPWLVELINEHAPQPRIAAGEESDPYPDLLRRAEAPAIETIGEQDLVDVAERLWPIFAGSRQSDRVRQLNALLEESVLEPRVDEQGAIRWRSRRRGGRALLLAGCAAALLEAVERHGWQRIGICAGEHCQDVYIAVTGRGSRRYCSHTCLNRARARAYRSRQSQ